MNKRRLISVLLITVVVGTGGMIGGATGTSQPIEGGGTIIEVSHEQTVATGDSAEITVKTSNSAGTTIALKPDGFQIEVSSSDGRIVNNRVRFLDVSNGNSTHTVEVDVTGGQNGDTAEIIVWVDAEERTDATDVSMSTIEIEGQGTNSGESNERDTSRSDERGSSGDKTVDKNEKNKSIVDEVVNNTSQTNNSLTQSTNQQTNEKSPEPNEKNTNNGKNMSEYNGESKINNSTTANGADENTNESIPGFGFLVSVVAFVGCGYAIIARRWPETKN